MGQALRWALGSLDTVRRVEEGMLPWGFSARRRQGREGHNGLKAGTCADTEAPTEGCTWLGLAGGRGPVPCWGRT